ncbi:MAG: hypothetical protein Q8P80_00150 [Candidatus Levybacteria bacterium]|nr:hypothetical protein [Candidatus Levybacteria bacterium]
MRKIIYLLLIVLIVVLAVFLFGGNRGNKGNRGDGGNGGNKIYETQTNSKGEVTVEVTPVSLSAKENVKFSITLNTHSVVLDKDLKTISVLFDDEGKEYQAISWDGGVGGHHLEGILTFPPLSSSSRSIKLRISGIANINREFNWQLK